MRTDRLAGLFQTETRTQAELVLRLAGVVRGRITRPARPAAMDIVRLRDTLGYDNEKFIAQPFIEGSQSNVRVIKLSPGQALPPHRHGSSDLMLFVVEGEGVLQTDNGTVEFASGSLAFFQGDEELCVSNQGQVGLTMLAFLTPPFPPRSET